MLRIILWRLFAILAVIIGLYPILYLVSPSSFGLLDIKSEEILSDTLWNVGFYGHIIFGGISLLVGWLQFSPSLRRKNMPMHRKIGMVYFISVLISSVCGIFIGLSATGGLISQTGFITLGVIWLYTTGMGFWAIKSGDVSRHQIMLIYSYAACFAAVTLRIWLPILITLHQGDFIPAYRIVAWFCWVPNIIVAYFIIKKYASNTKLAGV